MISNPAILFVAPKKTPKLALVEVTIAVESDEIDEVTQQPVILEILSWGIGDTVAHAVANFKRSCRRLKVTKWRALVDPTQKRKPASEFDGAAYQPSHYRA